MSIARKPRILYLEGEPRWEFKFLKRAVEDDKTLDVASILRTAPNKLYRQGVCRPGDTAHPQVNGKCTEMEDGFPSKVEDLFAFDGLIFGSVDAPYLTKNQQELVKNSSTAAEAGFCSWAGKIRCRMAGGPNRRLPIFFRPRCPTARTPIRLWARTSS